MPQVVVGSPLLEQLTSSGQSVEIVGENGQRLGIFVPLDPVDRDLYDWARRQISDEELERRKTEVGGCSTPEALKKAAEGS